MMTQLHAAAWQRTIAEPMDMDLPAALLLSFVAALLGAAISLLMGGGWWSLGIAIAILAIGPIVILAITSRRD